MIAYLRLNTVIDDGDTSIAYAGTWNTIANLNDMYGSGNHYTGQPGATATTSFNGDRITVGTFGLCSSAGTIQIKVDGAVKFEQNMGYQCTHYNFYTPYAVELRNLGAGTHTLTISKSDTTAGYVYVDYIGVPSQNPPIVIYNGITKMLDAQYANWSPFDKGSDFAVAQCNQEIQQMIASGFDYNVVFVDESTYDPNADGSLLCPDQVHPDDDGQQELATSINSTWPNIAPKASMSASSQYSPNYAPSNVADAIIGIQDTGEWASNGEQNPWIQLAWASSQRIHKLVLYDRNNLIDAANGGTLTFSDGSSVPVTGLRNDGTGSIVTFPEKNVSWMKFQIVGGSGLNVGLSELQVF